MKTKITLLAALSIILGSNTYAEVSPIPEPLSLEKALSFATDPLTPEQQALHLRRLNLKSDHLNSQSSRGFKANIQGRMRWSAPIKEQDGSPIDDHSIGLMLEKELYQFGRYQALIDALHQEESALPLIEKEAYWQRREAIMRQFFAVLLADLDAITVEEEMTMAYLRFDKIRERHQLGQYSDFDLLRYESIFQQQMSRRTRATSQQRLQRGRLAIALARPNQLSSVLLEPDLIDNKHSLPQLEDIIELVQKHNPTLASINRQLNAEKKYRLAAQRSNMPRITAEAALYDRSRVTSTSDRWWAGIRIDIPLLDGLQRQSAVSRAHAREYEQQTLADQTRDELHHLSLELVLSHQELLQQRKESAINLEYRELYLDNARANYELEFSSDLGDAMAELSDAQHQDKRVKFEIALIWEQLRAMTDGHLDDLITDQEQK